MNFLFLKPHLMTLRAAEHSKGGAEWDLNNTYSLVFGVI
jgi:hypothetical protein